MESVDWDKPVQTRDGRKARVLCTDRKGASPVVALIDFPGKEIIGFYDEYGRRVPGNAGRGADLINVPERTDRVIMVRESVFNGTLEALRPLAEACGEYDDEDDGVILSIHLGITIGDCRKAKSALTALAQPEGADDGLLRGRIAYALTKRLVIDMPTARAAVDEAFRHLTHPTPDGCGREGKHQWGGLERGGSAMSKHTPGPWQKNGMVIAGADGTEVCLMGEPAQYAGDIGLLCPNADANARLIAAAPDMLKALQMEEELNRIGLIRAENDFIEAVNKARRDAIAKAEGRS